MMCKKKVEAIIIYACLEELGRTIFSAKKLCNAASAVNIHKTNSAFQESTSFQGRQCLGLGSELG